MKPGAASRAALALLLAAAGAAAPPRVAAGADAAEVAGGPLLPRKEGAPPAGLTAPPGPVSFRLEVAPALTRSGCNSGTCHGTPVGKNGFRLSLRGWDPSSDFAALTRELGGRRVNLVDPPRSLFLLKPLARVPHEGGRRLEEGSLLHHLLLRWVEEGARDDGVEAPALQCLELDPPERVIAGRPWRVEVRARARFAGGLERDVTALARFSSTDERVGAVSASGELEGRAEGEVHVVAEYLGRVAVARLVFLREAPPPAGTAPPEENVVDRHVFEKLRLLGIPASPEASPEELLRRTYLDTVGLLPTPEEARRYLADPSPERQARLVDDLLARPEYAHLWGMRYADRLGVNQRFVGIQGAFKYHAWLVHAISINLPEDELAGRILTASGGNYSQAPAGFFRRLRDPGTAGENAAQLFLGVRLQCARCHNHPGERWTQEDYWGMAAFFQGLKFKDGPFFNHLYDKEETVYIDPRAPQLVHPRTGAPVKPRFLGGGEAEPAAADRRPLLANWLRGEGRRQFARAAANRIWFHLFGRGIVEPVDDFRVSNPPSSEPLLEALAEEFLRSGLDRKRLIRLILLSRAYGLSSRPVPGNEDDEKYFSHARVRLLPAEVLLDAMSAAAGVPESLSGLPAGFRAVQVPDGEYGHRFLAAFGRPARAMACECERESGSTVSQALHLVAGKTIDSKVRSPEGRAARLAAQGKPAREAVEDLFLASLTRHPTPEEMDLVAARVESAPDRRRALEDTLWALLNHPEFLHQH